MKLRFYVIANVYYLLICSWCYSSQDIDIQLAKARANGIYILSNSPVANDVKVQSPPAELPPTEQIGKDEKTEKTEQKQKIYVTYSNSYCPPCEDFKAQLDVLKKKGLIKDLPFEVVVTNDPPVRPVHYPFIVWKNSKDKWIYLDGWAGMNNLINTWKFSQEAEKTSLRFNIPNLDHYNARWTWPGDLRKHLQSTHNVDTSGLSTNQLEMLHDGLHENTYVNN